MHRYRAMVWLLSAFLFASFAAAELPAEAQRSGAECRRRDRRSRARLARARRARERARAAQETRAAETVDMDFTAYQDDERPPPMDMSYVAEAERVEAERRRAMLDPELYPSAREEEATEPSGPVELGRYSPLVARVAARAFHRGLGYRDYSSGAVANYDLPLGAAALVAVDYYPIAHASNDLWAHFALSWSFVHSLGVESIGANDIHYPTNAYAWNVGLRYRVPLDDAGGEIGFEAGYGEHGFHVERGDLQSPGPQGVPAVDYDLVRLAVTGRFMIDAASIGGRLGYLPAIDTGEIASEAFFGGASAHGIEAGLEFTYALGLGFEVLAELDMRLFVLEFADDASGSAKAAGALDRYVGANVGLRWRMPSHSELRR
jgi:hypothetical protein